MSSHPYKPICDSSNVIILTWSGNQVEDCTTHNFLECLQDANHERLINKRPSFWDIIHTIFGVDVCCKVHTQPDIASKYTGG